MRKMSVVSARSLQLLSDRLLHIRRNPSRIDHSHEASSGLHHHWSMCLRVLQTAGTIDLSGLPRRVYADVVELLLLNSDDS